MLWFEESSVGFELGGAVVGRPIGCPSVHRVGFWLAERNVDPVQSFGGTNSWGSDAYRNSDGSRCGFRTECSRRNCDVAAWHWREVD